MLATKYRVDTHPIVRYWPKKGKTMLLITIYGRYKMAPYVIYYKSDGEYLEISYTGEKFGLEELRQATKSQEKRTIGGNGAKALLNNPDVSYRYEMGANIWTVKGTFKVFEYQRPIPEEISGLNIMKYYDEVIFSDVPDPVTEITYNIIAHHNIIYEKCTTVFILKGVFKRYYNITKQWCRQKYRQIVNRTLL